MEIKIITPQYRDEVNQILAKEWNCPPSYSKGKLIDTTNLPGFIFLNDEKIDGVITYNINGDECEVISLNSFDENKGIGTALIKAVLSAAKEHGCKRLWLIATNDDIGAIGFYQKRGFELAAVHINSITDIGRKMKPSIPKIGMNDIPIKHEFEFEIMI